MTAGDLDRGVSRTVELPIGGVHVREWPRDAPPLVLLHGMSGDWQGWLPIVPALARRYHLYAPDLRGHGVSPKPETGYTLDNYVADFLALLDALALPPVPVVAHSFGGAVAWLAARREPQRFTRLVLEDTPLEPIPAALEFLHGGVALSQQPVEAVLDHYRRRYPEWTEEQVQGRAAMFRQTSPGVFTGILAEVEALRSIGERLLPLDLPLLFVRGDDRLGGMVPFDAATRFMQRAPHGRLVSLAGVGHTIHVEAPDRFLAVILPFLEGDPAAS